MGSVWILCFWFSFNRSSLRKLDSDSLRNKIQEDPLENQLGKDENQNSHRKHRESINCLGDDWSCQKLFKGIDSQKLETKYNLNKALEDTFMMKDRVDELFRKDI